MIYRYHKPGIGLDTITEVLFLEAYIHHLLNFYCQEQPYYLKPFALFLQSSYKTEIRWTLDLITALQDNVDLGRITEKRYKCIVKYKTAFYSFCVPVPAAVDMAGIDGEKSMPMPKESCWR